VSYILVGVLLAVALVIMVLVLRRVAGAARRLARTRTQVAGEVDAATGMLRARSAALRVAVRDRRNKKVPGAVTKA
jgi:uncharacterized membrane protein